MLLFQPIRERPQEQVPAPGSYDSYPIGDDGRQTDGGKEVSSVVVVWGCGSAKVPEATDDPLDGIALPIMGGRKHPLPTPVCLMDCSVQVI